MAGIGEALFAYDVRLSARLRAVGDRSSFVRTAAIPLARSGDGWIWVAAATLVTLVGGADTRRRALAIVAGLLATAFAVRIGKRLTRRARPAGDWGGSYRRSDPHAFPSGHAARAAFLTTIAAALAPAWIGLGFAIWAGLVAASRVTLGVHYLSDVVAGAALGFVCGLVALLLIR